VTPARRRPGTASARSPPGPPTVRPGLPCRARAASSARSSAIARPRRSTSGTVSRVAGHAEGDAVAVGEDGDADPHGRPDRHVRDDLAQPPAERMSAVEWRAAQPADEGLERRTVARLRQLADDDVPVEIEVGIVLPPGPAGQRAGDDPRAEDGAAAQQPLGHQRTQFVGHDRTGGPQHRCDHHEVGRSIEVQPELVLRRHRMAGHRVSRPRRVSRCPRVCGSPRTTDSARPGSNDLRCQLRRIRTGSGSGPAQLMTAGRKALACWPPLTVTSAWGRSEVRERDQGL
jgi:hypothetical protein